MSLIIVEKPDKRSFLKLAINKKLVEDFHQELAIFSKNNKNEKLNFDNFANKLINELRKINKKDSDNVAALDTANETVMAIN